MEAQLIKLTLIVSALGSMGATHRTPNFVVHAPTSSIARQVGLMAEQSREDLAIEWLGETLPKWAKPCPIYVKVGQIGAGGATTFAFDRGEVFGWRMNVQGSLERILDSVIPHEVSHTIFASYFRRPLPRWADEGAATLAEHISERDRQQQILRKVWKTSRRIPLKQLLAIKEYPKEMQNVLTLYAEGYSLANFLVQAGGKNRYLRFLEDAHHNGWETAVRRQYSLKSIDDLDSRWNQWVLAGSPRLKLPQNQMLASNESDQPAVAKSPQNQRAKNQVVIRSQSPEHASATEKPASLKEKLLSFTLPRRIRGKDLSAPTPQDEDPFLREDLLRFHQQSSRPADQPAGPSSIESIGGGHSQPWMKSTPPAATDQKRPRPETYPVFQQPRSIATAKP